MEGVLLICIDSCLCCSTMSHQLEEEVSTPITTQPPPPPSPLLPSSYTLPAGRILTQSDPLRLFDPWGCRTTTSEGQFNYNGLRFQGRRRRTPFGSTANPANLILPQLVLRTDSPYNIQHLSAGRTSRATASAISCRHGRGSSIIIFDPTLHNIY